MDLDVLHCSRIHHQQYSNNLATAQQQKCNSNTSGNNIGNSSNAIQMLLTPPSARRNIGGNNNSATTATQNNTGNSAIRTNSNNTHNSNKNGFHGNGTLNVAMHTGNHGNIGNNHGNNTSNNHGNNTSNHDNGNNHSNNSNNQGSIGNHGNSNHGNNTSNHGNNTSNKHGNNSNNHGNDTINHGNNSTKQGNIGNHGNTHHGSNTDNRGNSNDSVDGVVTSSSNLSNNGCRNSNNTGVSFKKRNSLDDIARRSCLLTEDSRIVRVRKTVVFADARGLALTQVRIMSEPSSIPPFWSPRLLSHLTAAATGLPALRSRGTNFSNNGSGTNGTDFGAGFEMDDVWVPNFEQPARDYVEFRRRLDETNVALENVAVVCKDYNDYRCGILEESGTKIIGTVKVRNLEYHKEVTLRYTTDSWKTFKDVPCSHVPTLPSSKLSFGTYTLYDTFRFNLALPAQDGSAARVDFCLRFRCAGREHWDNNRGGNYAVRRVGVAQQGGNEIIKKVQEATEAKIGAWSEFASWEHLENNCPYW